MSSTLFVDAIEPNLSSGVHIPGHVIQVVSAVNRTNVSSGTTGAWIDFSAGAELVVTPLSASSKILIMLSPNIYVDRVAGNDNKGGLVVTRNGTQLGQSYTILRAFDRGSTGIQYNSKPSITFIDEPATTSAVTYKLYVRLGDTTATILINSSDMGVTVDGSTSAATTFIAQEIAQ